MVGRRCSEVPLNAGLQGLLRLDLADISLDNVPLHVIRAGAHIRAPLRMPNRRQARPIMGRSHDGIRADRPASRLDFAAAYPDDSGAVETRLLTRAPPGPAATSSRR
jgi:hypothetical protein